MSTITITQNSILSVHSQRRDVSNRLVKIFELPMCIAMDSSGSMAGSRWDRSARLITEITGLPDPKVISWDHQARKVKLNKVCVGGGTDPACFISFLGGIKTLLVTTDGEFNRPDSIVESIRQSDLLHVIAIFIGHQGNAPASLDLSVLGPFMEVPGIFVLCHFDGRELKVLIQRGANELPEPPSEIGPSTQWSRFPRIRPDQLRELTGLTAYLKPQTQKGLYVLSDNRTVINLQKTIQNISQMGESCFTELDRFIRKEAFTLAMQGKSEHLRELIKAWHRLAIIKAEEASKAELRHRYQRNKDRAGFLLGRIRNKTATPENQAEFVRLTADLYEDVQQMRALQAAYSEEHNRIYSELMRILSEPNEYTLAGLSRRNRPSNRALRATKVTIDWDAQKINTDGSFLVECDICAEKRTGALLLQGITEEQVIVNTNDFALNDAISIGPNNQGVIPSSSICLFCADLLRQLDQKNPYTRQEIAGVLPLVKLGLGCNLTLVSAELSRVLFGGKRLSIEMQTLLGILYALEPSGRFPSSIFDFLYREILYSTRSNFKPDTSKPLPLLKAIIDQVLTGGSVLETLQSLRNRSLFTLVTMISMAIRYKEGRPTDNYLSVLRMLFVKIVLGQILRQAKAGKLSLFRDLLDCDLFDCSTGMPIYGTEHLLDITKSKAFRFLFDSEYLKEKVLEPLSRYSKETGIPGREIIPRELITIVLSEGGRYVDTNLGEENFILTLMDKSERFSQFMFYLHLPKEKTVLKDLHNQKHRNVFRIRDRHQRVPQFSPIDLYAPPISFCASCAKPFGKWSSSPEQVKAARNRHFAEVYGADPSSAVPTERSGHVKLHLAVRTVASRYPEVERPTRKMVLEVLAYLKKRSKGNLFEPDLLEDITVCLWDFLQKRKKVKPAEGLRRIEERLVDELRADLKPQVMVATMDGLTEEEIAELTAPLKKTIQEELNQF